MLDKSTNNNDNNNNYTTVTFNGSLRDNGKKVIVISSWF